MKLVFLILLLGTTSLFMSVVPRMGAAPDAVELETSVHFRNGRFMNQVETTLGFEKGETLGRIMDFFRGREARRPSVPLPARALEPEHFRNGETLTVTWLGHSTCLIGIEGNVILTDPMFSDRASPLPLLGPKRFPTKRTYSVRDLPKIDVVLISHDHYDHLDYETIRALRGKVERFIVPLGVGAHLRRWGVDAERITELDWWKETQFGPLSFTATPARHFSGRGFRKRNRTLWASWAIAGPGQRVFFSGDSGYFSGFKEIGERLGPFDLTLLECGAYDKAWPDVHMTPEQTVQTHIDLKGQVLLPIHWGQFDLALHPWTEPVERLLKEGSRRGVNLTTPLIGEPLWPARPLPRSRWWRQLEDEPQPAGAALPVQTTGEVRVGERNRES